MEPNTKPELEVSTSRYGMKDFLPLAAVLSAAALFATFMPQGFFGLGRMEFAAWIGCVCAVYQMWCVGPSRFELFEETAVRLVSFAALIFGTLFLIDGMIFPTGTLIPTARLLKTLFLTLLPFVLLATWGFESVFVSRRMRSKAKLQKSLDAVREYAKRVADDADKHLKEMKG